MIDMLLWNFQAPIALELIQTNFAGDSIGECQQGLKHDPVSDDFRAGRLLIRGTIDLALTTAPDRSLQAIPTIDFYS